MKKIIRWIVPAAVIAAVLAACGNNKITYTLELSGTAQGQGVLNFLDYSINIYQDEASNPCGDCADQPVHLYAGDSAEEAAQAVCELIEEADDIWAVDSVDGSKVVLSVREGENVTDFGSLVAADGLSARAVIDNKGTVTEIRSEQGGPEETVPVTSSERLAAVYGPSYEMLVCLGAEDRIVVRADVQTDSFPWAEKVFARIAEVPALNNVHAAVNFEELMKYSPDLVFTFPRQNEINQLARAGIASVEGSSYRKLSDTCDMLRVYADALGGSAPARADSYCSYFGRKLDEIGSVISKIPLSERKSVYYAGMSVLTTCRSQKRDKL